MNLNEAHDVNFEVFMVVTVQIAVFGVVRPYLGRLCVSSVTSRYTV
jgi:hypothetical protein